MKRLRTIGIVTVISAIAVTAAVSAHAAPTSVVDRTYSCKVRPQRYIDLNTSVTLPPTQDAPQRPANLNLFTVKKTFKQNGFTFNLPQVFFQAAKGTNPKIDKPTCRPSSRKVALKPSGLRLTDTVTPRYLGFFDQRCVTAKRVLVHVRITLSGGVPVAALVAVRNDNRTRRPVEFLNWRSRKIKGYFGKSCVSTANG
ncbi:MAG TPA: hypothetical protein VGK68_01390 [Gaiellaceae bacterium]